MSKMDNGGPARQAGLNRSYNQKTRPSVHSNQNSTRGDRQKRGAAVKYRWNFVGCSRQGDVIEKAEPCHCADQRLSALLCTIFHSISPSSCVVDSSSIARTVADRHIRVSTVPSVYAACDVAQGLRLSHRHEALLYLLFRLTMGTGRRGEGR